MNANRLMEQRYFDLRQTAFYLGLSPKTIYAWAENKKIPAYKVGRLWRFDKTELDDFVRREVKIFSIMDAVGKCSGSRADRRHNAYTT